MGADRPPRLTKSPPRFRGKFKLSTYQAFLVAIYFILAGAVTISVEMKDWPFVERWVPFLYTFWGRGGWYLFWSLLVAACVEIKIYGAFAASTPSA